MRVGRRLFFVFVTAAVLVGAASTVVAAATVNAADSGPRALAAACPAGSKRAVIGGKVKCLRAGQKCATRYQAAYKRYGFMCVSGHLRKRPGHSKGTTSQLELIEFDVTADGTRVVSLLTGQINEGCNPPAHLYGGNLHDGTAPIAADGSFKIDFDYTSQVGSDPSTGHFTLTGKFNGTGFTGTLQDNVSFTDQGTPYSCGSGLQTWTASRTA